MSLHAYMPHVLPTLHVAMTAASDAQRNGGCSSRTCSLDVAVWYLSSRFDELGQGNLVATWRYT